MGTSHEMVCRGCGFTISVKEGVGFFDSPTNLKQACLVGEYGEIVKALVQANPLCEIKINRYLSQCRQCGSFETQERLTIYGQELEGKKPGVKLRKLKNGIVAYYHRSACSQCSGRLVKVNPDEIEVCPKCHSGSSWTRDSYCWD